MCIHVCMQESQVESENATESTNNWHLKFEIPKFLSCNESVRKSIKTGIVSSKARRDIIQTLRTLIVQKTKFPNSVQYVTVSRKLIAKYPKVTWTLSLT